MSEDRLSALRALAFSCPYQFYLPEAGQDLAALGGDLTPSTLLYAYLHGFFPWFNAGEPIAWYHPAVRCVFVPSAFHPAKSLQRNAKKYAKAGYHLSLNHAFKDVMHACSLPRAYSEETWIHDEMKESYANLHKLGVAFSLELWAGEPLKSDLVGGLYGLQIGACVFGESMFHRQTDASKLAFWALARLCEKTGIPLIDCQLPNDYLLGLGADIMTRADFLTHLAVQTDPSNPATAINWQDLTFCQPLSWLYEGA